MFTETQKKEVERIIAWRDKNPTVPEGAGSWRYAVWQGGKIVGEKDYWGNVTKLY